MSYGYGGSVDRDYAVAVGDTMRMSVELIREIAKEPDFTSHVVRVKEVRVESDGNKILVLERVP